MSEIKRVPAKLESECFKLVLNKVRNFDKIIRYVMYFTKILRD